MHTAETRETPLNASRPHHQGSNAINGQAEYEDSLVPITAKNPVGVSKGSGEVRAERGWSVVERGLPVDTVTHPK